jgi:hypothetical protein
MHGRAEEKKAHRNFEPSGEVLRLVHWKARQLNSNSLLPTPRSSLRHPSGLGFRGWKTSGFLQWMDVSNASREFLMLMGGTRSTPAISMAISITPVVLIRVTPQREGLREVVAPGCS